MSSVGVLIMFSFTFLRLNASANEIGPILPKYMVAIIISLPQKFKVEVKFLVRPTVAVALTVSYAISSAEAFVTRERSRVDKNIMLKDMATTAIAFRIASFEMVRLNIVTSFLFLIDARADAINTVIVTVFTPPAVPNGEPPINISSSDRIADEFVKFSCGMVANPAVLVVTD